MGTFLGFKMSKSREREEKLRQKKAERRKKSKTWKHEKKHRFVGFSGNFYYEQLGKMKFKPKKVPTRWGSPIYIYIYAVHMHAVGRGFGPILPF